MRARLRDIAVSSFRTPIAPAFPQPHRHAVLMRRNAAACSDCSRPRKRSQHVEPLTPSDRFEPFPEPGARAAPDPRPRAGPWGSPFPASRPGRTPRFHEGPSLATAACRGTRFPGKGRDAFPGSFPGRRRRASAKQPGKPPAAGAAFAFPPCRARNPRRPPLALRAHRRPSRHRSMRGRARRRGARREGGHHAEEKGFRPREHAGDVGVLQALRGAVPAGGDGGAGRVPRLRGGALRAVRELREPDPARRAAEAEGDPRRLCPTCASELTRVCDGCGRRLPRESGFIRDGRGRALCPDCAEGYAECADCGEWFPAGDMARRDGDLVCWRCSARRLDGAICSCIRQ